MTLHLSKFLQNAVQVNTSAGKLWLYSPHVKDLDTFGRLPADIGPRNRLRSFLPCIASRVVVDDRDGPAGHLNISWCQQLSDEDLERIASAYLSSAAFHNVADDDSLTSDRISPAADETAIDHLDRLLTAEHARHTEEIRKESELFRQQFGSAFATLSDDAEKQFSSANELAAKSDRDEQIAQHPTLPSVNEDAPAGIANEGSAALVGGELRTSDSSHELEARQQADEHDGSVRGEEVNMADTTAKTEAAWANLPFDVDETAPQFPKELAADAGRSDASARWSLRIAISALVFSMLLAGVAVIFSVERYYEEQRNNQAMSQWRESISQMIKDADAAQERRLRLLDEKILELSARQNALEAARVATVPEATPPPKRAPVKTARVAKARRSPKP